MERTDIQITLSQVSSGFSLSMLDTIPPQMMDIVDMAIQVGGPVICFENITSELW